MQRSFASAILSCTLLWGFATVSRAATITFDFNADATGTATPFTDTVSVLSATFSSSGDPGGFQIAGSFFLNLTRQVLLDPGPANLAFLTLTIRFSAPQSDISMNFATDSATPVPFSLQAFNGVTPVGTSSATGTIPSPPGGLFTLPEGLIRFGGGPFNSVVLSAAAPHFAIDNITVTDIPEPGSLRLCVAGLAVLVFACRRRNSYHPTVHVITRSSLYNHDVICQ
jgi:hypothetical protein